MKHLTDKEFCKQFLLGIKTRWQIKKHKKKFYADINKEFTIY